METTDNPLTQAGRKAWALYRRDKRHEITQPEFADRLTSPPGAAGWCCLCKQWHPLIIGVVCLRCGGKCLVRP